jgi:Predicted sugar kinase
MSTKIGIVFKPMEEAKRASEDFAKLILSKQKVELLGPFCITDLKVGDLDLCDAIFTFGGDGTILKTARILNSAKPVLVGVNYGRLGFLAEVSPPLIENVLNDILTGHFPYYTIPRIIGRLYSEKESAVSPPALNEFFFAADVTGRLITLKIVIQDTMVYKGRMDGLIVSTAMGSTAYSLSAGGPVVDPEAEVTVLTHIAPINIALRPIVVNKSKKISIINVDTNNIKMIIDGMHWRELLPGEHLEISEFEIPIKLYRAQHDLLTKLFEKRLMLERKL